MFELPIACGGCRARGKTGTKWAGDNDGREGQWSGLTEVADGGGWSWDVLSHRQPCLACLCSVALSCDSL